MSTSEKDTFTSQEIGVIVNLLRDFGIKIESVKRLSNDTLLQVTVSLPPKR
jgi:hypothetical protein